MRGVTASAAIYQQILTSIVVLSSNTSPNSLTSYPVTSQCGSESMERQRFTSLRCFRQPTLLINSERIENRWYHKQTSTECLDRLLKKHNSGSSVSPLTNISQALPTFLLHCTARLVGERGACLRLCMGDTTGLHSVEQKIRTHFLLLYPICRIANSTTRIVLFFYREWRCMTMGLFWTRWLAWL